MRQFFCVLPLLVLLTGCGAQMRNLPVGKGNTVISTSVGGPLVYAFNATVPIPYAMAGMTHGISDRLDVFGDVHLMAAMFKFGGFTPGAVYFPDLPMSGWVPAVKADAMVFSDFNQVRIFPELTFSIAHPTASRWTPYLGFHNTFQMTKAPVYLPSVFGGASYRAGRFRIYGELQWLAMNRKNLYTPVEYQGFNNHGAIATQAGLSLDVTRRPR